VLLASFGGGAGARRASQPRIARKWLLAIEVSASVSPRSPTGRTQQERSEATTTALVSAARELFAQDGYAATSLDAVCAHAGVTKGALYHHFEGKRELLAAVFSLEQKRLGAATVAAYTSVDDPWAAVEAGCRAFIEACQEPGVQRIVLLDAPPALGWETIRRLETGSLAMMQLGIERAIDAGRIGRHAPRPLAHLLFGAVCELAMAVARSENQEMALRESVAELGRLLDALAV
jgi:AcrR family transcriptional regulator